MTDLTSQRRARTAVTVAFAAQGFLLAALLTQLPRYESRFQLAASLIVVAVVTVSLIAGGGSILAEQIVRRSSSKSALVTGLVVIAVAGGAIGLAQSTATFFVLLGLYGLGVGIIDAAANMQAVSIQHAYGRVILSSFHAAWSAGAIIGALFVAAAVGLGMSLTATQVSAGLVVAGALAVIAPRFLSTTSGVAPGAPAPAGAPEDSTVPARALLALGAAMAMFYAVDFSVGNWSALYLTNVLLADAGTAALGIAAYQCAALLSRTTGDWWVRRHGEKTVVRAGALIGTAGL
ncbi:MAG: MFS transporter, partial [Rhodococcus sp.]|nr:MFS transporter [Rhodococcus sp. (in: high G+C Gram-positive bacteria)]